MFRKIMFSSFAGLTVGLLFWTGETSYKVIEKYYKTPQYLDIIWPDMLVYIALGVALAVVMGLLLNRLSQNQPLVKSLIVGGVVFCFAFLTLFYWYQQKKAPDYVSLSWDEINLLGCITTAIILVISLVIAGGVGNAYRYFLAKDKDSLIHIICFVGILASIAGLAAYDGLSSDFYVAGEKAGSSAHNTALPNVVFLSADTLRADHLSCFGGKRVQTGSIDRLADEGVLFSNCMAQASSSCPSFGSIMTSLYPSQRVMATIEGRKGLKILNTANVTLAEILKECGFSTVAIQANPLLSESRGFSQGFDEYCETDYLSGVNEMFSVLSIPALLHKVSRRPTYDAGALVHMAQQWISSNKARPFFMWINFMDCHQPYFSHETSERFGGIPSDLVGKRFTPQEKALLPRLYASEVRFLDGTINEFVRFLRKKCPNSLIVFFSDHGEEFWDHGGKDRGFDKYYDFGWEHGHTLYQELIHVPLIFWYPDRLPRHKRVDSMVRGIDIMPTVLDLLGIVPTIQMEGRSLVGYLQAEADIPEGSPAAFSDSLIHGPEKTAIISGGYKLVLHTESERIELYDLCHDPLEQHDLANVNPEKVTYMKPQLLKWMAAQQEDTVGKTEMVHDSSADKKLERKLRELGYVN